MNQETVVIVAAKRTPMGSFMGSIQDVQATELGAHAIRSVLSALPEEENNIDEVIMGCVLPAGLKQAPARQATLGAGLPLSTGATTINKVCGSGLKSVMLAHDILKAGSAKAVVAGGMESMSNAPYLLEKARAGYRMGHGQVLDHMMLDGLQDAYEGKAMGVYAQEMADTYGFSREDMDEFAVNSLIKAKDAIEQGKFADEIVAVEYDTRKGTVTVSQDEQPGRVHIDKIPQLRPAFTKNGTVTAANSSSISDGAAALLVMTASEAERRGLTPLATIVGHATHAQKPSEFTLAPVGAMTKLLQQIGWNKEDVDLWEINEAFAMVTMIAMKDMELKEDKVNIHGGACALGHPIGASGARLLVTLIHALKANSLKKGVVSLCIGGGEAVALAVELVK